MIVYRDVPTRLDPRRHLRMLATDAGRLSPARPDRDAATDLLIAFGALEAAVVDALCPEVDGFHPTAAAYRRLAERIGRVWLAAQRNVAADTGALAGDLRTLAEAPQPAEVTVKLAEGFAWYGLYPQAFARAAEDAAAAVRPARAVCLGLRGIGTALSALAAAALQARGVPVWTWTLRPHGHPFDRRPRLDADLAARLLADPTSVVLMVDEGPGLSGSSLCGTAAALSDLGIPDERILILPAWIPDGSAFVSDTARARWTRHAKFATPFDRAWAGVPADAEDLSGGAWRARLFDSQADWPVVQPQHERLKFRVPGRTGRTLLKFAGLGPHGRKVAARAEALAAAGFAPPVEGFGNGMLAQPWLEGRPLRSRDWDRVADRALAYLAHRATAFRTGTGADPDPLVAMLRQNAAEALGTDGPTLDRLDRWRPLLAEAPAVEIDGRMAPHEWLATAGGIVKTDGVDHCDGHVLPGATDIAWDVADLADGFGLDEGTAQAFTQRLAEMTGDASLPRRLPFYRAAVAAFRVGYADLAAKALAGTPDGDLFAIQRARDAAALTRTLAVLP
ncbi:MAG TPA: hypothetical protein VEY95_04075 [Azospirillaceae bacterium]|nr:hypothetical protein [Azospirillaceae bacterium]